MKELKLTFNEKVELECIISEHLGKLKVEKQMANISHVNVDYEKEDLDALIRRISVANAILKKVKEVMWNKVPRDYGSGDVVIAVTREESRQDASVTDEEPKLKHRSQHPKGYVTGE